MSYVAAFIIASEVGFWVALTVGLGLRYLAGRRRAGAVVLALVPVLDVVLLTAVAVDLHFGAAVTHVHQLAGLYLGGSVAFGPSLVRWADGHVAFRLGKGPRPVKAPKRGPLAVRHELRSFGRWLVAAAVTAAALGLLAVTVADRDQVAGLLEVLPALGVVTALWLVTGPLWAVGQQVADAAGPARPGPQGPPRPGR